tara:strand:- start:565 stop:1470 length:906 start_codon:yes stop_codon:yes gene_type:complete
LTEKSINWLFPEKIIDCDTLNEKLGNNEIRVFDCTTFLDYTDDHPSKPYDVKSCWSNYKDAHIPAAAYLDLQKDLSDDDSPYGLTLPDLESLAEKFEKLGIGSPYHIVLYANNGMQWATRIWAMLAAVGYTKVSVLNGGLREWKRLGFATESGINEFETAEFKAKLNTRLFVDKNEVVAALGREDSILLNSLTEDIFKGKSTRYGRPGRIPGSINIPFHELLETDRGTLKSPKQILSIISNAGMERHHKIINYCGGGIAATLTTFVLYQLGFEKLGIYDNSMSEWATDESLPIEVGDGKSK